MFASIRVSLKVLAGTGRAECRCEEGKVDKVLRQVFAGIRVLVKVFEDTVGGIGLL